MSRVGLRPVKLSEWVIGQAEAISEGTKTDTCCDVQALHNRAATSLARLWQSQDKHQDAYDLLAPMYSRFTEGFDTTDLQEAKTLLQEFA